MQARLFLSLFHSMLTLNLMCAHKFPEFSTKVGSRERPDFVQDPALYPKNSHRVLQSPANMTLFRPPLNRVGLSSNGILGTLCGDTWARGANFPSASALSPHSQEPLKNFRAIPCSTRCLFIHVAVSASCDSVQRSRRNCSPAKSSTRVRGTTRRFSVDIKGLRSENAAAEGTPSDQLEPEFVVRIC